MENNVIIKMMVFNNYIGQTLGTNPQLILKREKSITGHEISIFLKNSFKRLYKFQSKVLLVVRSINAEFFFFFIYKDAAIITINIIYLFLQLIAGWKKKWIFRVCSLFFCNFSKSLASTVANSLNLIILCPYEIW